MIIEQNQIYTITLNREELIAIGWGLWLATHTTVTVKGDSPKTEEIRVIINTALDV